jgi:hypothetical protein
MIPKNDRAMDNSPGATRRWWRGMVCITGQDAGQDAGRPVDFVSFKIGLVE